MLADLRERVRGWMLRVRGPETQPIRLPQSRIYVLPSATGMVMGITLLVMLITSINYNLSLGFAFTFLIGGIGVAHILASWRNLLGLEIRAQATGEAFAGGEAAFIISLCAPDDGPNKQRLDIEVSHFKGLNRLHLNLAHNQSASATLYLPATRRGAMPLGRICIECRAPLGWVRAWAYVAPDALTLVYPKPLGDLVAGQLHAAAASEGHSPHPGHEEFAGLRNATPSDSPRHIAWKQLARGGPLLAKQFSGGSSTDWWLNWSHLPNDMDVETRLSQLSQWVLSARKQGLRTQLELPGISIGPGHDAIHHAACLQALALFQNGAAHA